jgi:hypothetical protein
MHGCQVDTTPGVSPVTLPANAYDSWFGLNRSRQGSNALGLLQVMPGLQVADGSYRREAAFGGPSRTHVRGAHNGPPASVKQLKETPLCPCQRVSVSCRFACSLWLR